METILPYAFVLFPVLLLLWVAFQEISKYFRSEQGNIYNEAVRGIAKAQGWLSYDEAVELLEKGEYEYSQGVYAAQMLGDLPPCELSERAVRALIRRLNSSEAKIRLASAVSLGRIGDISAIPALRLATESSPTADEISWYESALFDKELHEARARREGYSISKINVADPTELHAKVRQAATWAIQEISERNRGH